VIAGERAVNLQKGGKKGRNSMKFSKLSVVVLFSTISILFAQGDNCINAMNIPSLPFWIFSNTAGYNNDYSLPDSGCTGNTTLGPDAVFSYTPQTDICLSLEVIIPQSGWDASIYVFTDCDNMVCVAGVDQFGPGSPEALNISMMPGVTYYFVVDGRNPTDYGPFVLGLSECLTDVKEGVTAPSFELISFDVKPSVTRNSAKFFFSLPFPDRVKIDVYDASGRLVKSLFNETKREDNIIWNCDDMKGQRVEAGVYFVKFEAMGKRITRKVVILR
jgi:hypothetical protein